MLARLLIRRTHFITEVNIQEGNPCDVLDEGRENVPLAKTVFQQCETEVSSPRKDDCAGKPDFKAMHVEAVDLIRKPQKEVVEYGKDSGSGNAVVREHVGHHADFVMDRCVRPQENAQLFCDRPQSPPANERIEDKLVAT